MDSLTAAEGRIRPVCGTQPVKGLLFLSPVFPVEWGRRGKGEGRREKGEGGSVVRMDRFGEVAGSHKGIYRGFGYE